MQTYKNCLGTLYFSNIFFQSSKGFRLFFVALTISNIKRSVSIKPVGFIVGLYNIYLTTDNGKLLIIDTVTGVTSSVIKIDNDKISRPFVLNKNLYIIKDSSIIKLN